MMAYYADLYLSCLRLRLKSISQYRADFFIMMVASLTLVVAQLIFLNLIFTNIHELQGWSFQELLLIFGLMTTTRSLWNTFLDVPHRIYWYILRGDLDRLLVRPPAPLFQIAGESGFNLPSIGQVVIGMVTIGIAISGLQTQLPWWWIFYLLLTVISGILILFSVNMLMACLCFWFTNVYSLLTTMNWMTQFGQYPVSIFSLPLQFLFTWVLPFAMMAFYPAAFLLRGDEYRLYGLLAPLVGFPFLGLALSFWQLALRRYQSTGS